MSIGNRSYTSGHFELSIDGHKTTAYLKSIEGGDTAMQVISERFGSSYLDGKHLAIVEPQPFSIDMGMSGANEMLRWIQQSWRNARRIRHSGEIRHANFDLDAVFTHEFKDAAITETLFPTLDGGSKEPAYLKVKFLPVSTTMKTEKTGQVLPNLGPKQKMWLCSAFRLTIDGIHGVEYTNKIESFAIKQKAKHQWVGSDTGPVDVITYAIEFPNLECTISLAHADALLKWFKQAHEKGTNERAHQKTGVLEFLSPDRSETLFTINLNYVQIHGWQVISTPANADQIKRAKFKLMVGEMDLGGKDMGFD